MVRVRRVAVLACVGVGIWAGLSSASTRPRWVPTELGHLPFASDSGAVAINAGGEITGWSGPSTPGLTIDPRATPCRDRAPIHAFVWSSGRMIDLGTLGGPTSFPVAIDNRGDVIGRSDTRTCDVHGFLWRKGRMVDLGSLGGRPRCPGCPLTDPRAINDRGQIVGASETRSGAPHAFLWQDGRMTDLGTLGGSGSGADDINARGQVVGWADTATRGQSHAVLWHNGKVADLGTLGGPSSEATAINDGGEIVGSSGDGKPPHEFQKPFLWQNGRMIELAPPVAAVVAIDDSGRAFGNSAPRGPGFNHVLVWQDGRRIDLGRGYAVAVSDHDQIVGGNNPIGNSVSFALLWDRGRRVVLGRGSAIGINPQGTEIVGVTSRPDGSGGAVLWRRK
jgi:probable HAF family extracellular repeat protein